MGDRLEQLKSYVANLSTEPGVYLMYDIAGKIIYVGKAKNLRKRVKSYFAKNLDNEKVIQLMSVVVNITVTITPSEIDALILEISLIKKHLPRYNVQFKDSKGYPYIAIDINHEFPRLTSCYEKNSNAKMVLYGPYPNKKALFYTLNYLYKIFKLRDCDDAFFSNRSRPCLRYQIGRCSAPCTGLISVADYEQTVTFAMQLLSGKNQEVLNDIREKMEHYSKLRDYLKAAEYRDLLNFIEILLQKQIVSKRSGDQDYISIVNEYGMYCIHVLQVRNGEIIATESYFPKYTNGYSAKEILVNFLSSHYLQVSSSMLPKEIIINELLPATQLLLQAIKFKHNKIIRLNTPQRGDKKKIMEMGSNSALAALQARLKVSDFYQGAMLSLGNLLEIAKPPMRLECFDISHFQGEATVASCVIMTIEGPQLSQYRQYKLPHITTGDDYLALSSVILQRYQKILDNNEQLPDIVIIDGGIGQLSSVAASLAKMRLSQLPLIAIAKGAERKAGLEKIYLRDREITNLIKENENVFMLLQRIRDESHKYAITCNRRAMRRRRQRSPLLNIPGIGEQKRKLLLKHFGGMQDMLKAEVVDLAQVPGIGTKLAKIIYEYIHSVKK